MSAPARTRYIDVLRLPHAARAFVPAIIGKMSFAMVSLALLLLVQQESGSFALSGAVAGAFGLGNVIAAPLRARLVDQYGARMVMPWLAVGYTAGLIGIIIAAHLRADGMGVLIATLAGLFAPPVGAVMRGIWVLLTPSTDQRTRAYSLDAVVEELVFIVGPLLVGLVVLLPNGPTIAVAIAAAIGLIGTLGMVFGPTPQPGRAGRRASSWRGLIGPLRLVRFWPVLASLAAVGIVLGSIELLSTAHANEFGDSSMSGLLLAFFAAGSATGGLLYGARAWVAPPLRRMVLLGLAACAGLFAVAWSTHIPTIAILFAAVGIFVAPSMITGYLAADDVAPVTERTEASALINTAVNAGSAIALALGGALLDGMPITHATLWLAAAAAACIGVAAVVALLGGGRPHRPAERV